MMHLREEHLLMQDMVRQFAKKEIAPLVDEMEKTKRIPEDLLKKMGENGLFGITVPEAFGGAEMDYMSNIIAIHEISKVSAAVGVLLSVHTSVGTKPIMQFGTQEQKERYVRKLATGEYIGAFALTEAHAGSDASNIRLRARRDGNGYVLNGEKVFITNGREADIFVTFARTSDLPRSQGISAFIVEKDTPGLIVGKNEAKMGLHGASTVTLTFDNCRLPLENMLGPEGEGFHVAMNNLQTGRIGIAAQALGIAEGAFELARDYAKEREQFGKPISHLQGISFMLADMATAIEASKLLVYQAASAVDQDRLAIENASMAKLLATKTAMKTAIDAVQIFGGYGYTEDYPIERYFRDAKVTEIYEGTSEIQKVVISKQLLKS